MKTLPCIFVALALALPMNAQIAHSPLHWAYDGDTGPAHWGDLSAKFSTCKSGREQSPIDIRDAKASKLPAIKFDYQPSQLRIIDNGHTVQVNYAAGSSIMAGNKIYQLTQIHFHHPSEEQINGRASDMVAHLVHADAGGNKAVVAVLLKQGKSNAFVRETFAHLPRVKGKEDSSDATIDASELLPANHAYYTFPGSLTTPPCSEGVTWFVLRDEVSVSSGEIAEFARFYPRNVRPVQPLNGRTILVSQ